MEFQGFVYMRPGSGTCKDNKRNERQGERKRAGLMDFLTLGLDLDIMEAFCR